MDPESVIRVGQEALLLVLILSAPAVLAALVVGLMVSVLQAATQLQEQTLSIAPKIVAVYVVLAITGLWMVNEVVRFATLLLGRLARIGM